MFSDSKRNEYLQQLAEIKAKEEMRLTEKKEYERQLTEYLKEIANIRNLKIDPTIDHIPSIPSEQQLIDINIGNQKAKLSELIENLRKILKYTNASLTDLARKREEIESTLKKFSDESDLTNSAPPMSETTSPKPQNKL